MSLKQFIIRSCALLALVSCNQSVQAGTASFMTIADIHFDPFAACANVTPCPLIQELESTPASTWQTVLARGDTALPQYRQDTGYVLLQSALKAFQSTATKAHPQFIIVLGDLMGHHFQEKYQKFSADKSDTGYREFVKKTQMYLASELKYPDTDVYITVGNNDSYLGDYVTDANGAFFQDMGNLWGQLIDDQTSHKQMQRDFAIAGYYALDIPEQPTLRLVVLNTNIFSPLAKQPEGTADKELDWFEGQLKQARLHHQHVLIAMHIPAGINVYASLKQNSFKLVEMWQPEYTQRYARDLEEYSDNISGILSGHTHKDSFQVIETKTGGKIPVSGIPSISPSNGNNPGFKIFSYDTQTLLLQNYTTFYTSLATLNWQQEYDFNAIYQADNNKGTLVTGFEQLTTSGKLANAYQLYYDTTAGTDQIHNYYNPYYWCQLKTITAAEYQTCIG